VRQMLIVKTRIAVMILAGAVLTAGCSSTKNTTSSEKKKAGEGWTQMGLGPVDEHGLRRIQETVGGFDIRYALGPQTLTPVDVEVYDHEGHLVVKIDRLEKRPAECMWNQDMTGVIIDGQTYKKR
jgi:hypothetical protein